MSESTSSMSNTTSSSATGSSIGGYKKGTSNTRGSHSNNTATSTSSSGGVVEDTDTLCAPILSIPSIPNTSSNDHIKGNTITTSTTTMTSTSTNNKLSPASGTYYTTLQHCINVATEVFLQESSLFSGKLLLLDDDYSLAAIILLQQVQNTCFYTHYCAQNTYFYTRYCVEIHYFYTHYILFTYIYIYIYYCTLQIESAYSTDAECEATMVRVLRCFAHMPAALRHTRCVTMLSSDATTTTSSDNSSSSSRVKSQNNNDENQQFHLIGKFIFSIFILSLYYSLYIVILIYFILVFRMYESISS